MCLDRRFKNKQKNGSCGQGKNTQSPKRHPEPRLWRKPPIAAHRLEGVGASAPSPSHPSSPSSSSPSPLVFFLRYYYFFLCFSGLACDFTIQDPSPVFCSHAHHLKATLVPIFMSNDYSADRRDAWPALVEKSFGGLWPTRVDHRSSISVWASATVSLPIQKPIYMSFI